MNIPAFLALFSLFLPGPPASVPQDSWDSAGPNAAIRGRDRGAFRRFNSSPSLRQGMDSDENDRRRDEEFHIEQGLDTIGIKPGMTVGEVGAGWGYLVFKLARRVGPNGTVFANDIDSDALEILRARALEKGFHNITTILGTGDDPRLPKGALDMIFMHDTIHLLDKPVELFNNLASGLKRGGRLVVIEWEREKGLLDRSGTRVHPREFRTTREFLELFGRTVFQVDRVDGATLPYLMIFILSVKNGRADVEPKKPRIVTRGERRRRPIADRDKLNPCF